MLSACHLRIGSHDQSDSPMRIQNRTRTHLMKQWLGHGTKFLQGLLLCSVHPSVCSSFCFVQSIRCSVRPSFVGCASACFAAPPQTSRQRPSKQRQKRAIIKYLLLVLTIHTPNKHTNLVFRVSFML